MENPLCYGMSRAHDWYQKDSEMYSKLLWRLLGSAAAFSLVNSRLTEGVHEIQDPGGMFSTFFHLETGWTSDAAIAILVHVSQQLLSGFKSVHWFPLIRSNKWGHGRKSVEKNMTHHNWKKALLDLFGIS